jgi:hypothetical protein
VGWTIQDSNPDKGKELFSSPKRPDRVCGQPSLFQWVSVYFAGTKRPGREFDYLLRYVPRLRMRGAVPMLPLSVFMVWAGYLYLFAFLFCHQSLIALRAAVEVFVLPGCCTGCVDTKQNRPLALLDTSLR